MKFVTLIRKPPQMSAILNAVTCGCGALHIKASSLNTGRWPANLILQGPKAVETMTASSGMLSGVSTYASALAGKEGFSREIYGTGKVRPKMEVRYGDSGSAVRFFKVVADKTDQSGSG